MKKFRHMSEAAMLAVGFFIFRLMPLDIASAIGDALGRAAGPFFKAHKRALITLSSLYPERSRRELIRLLGDMWGHLGRVIAEYPSLPGNRLLARTVIYGAEHLPRKGESALFFSGHLGNWELLTPVANSHGVDLSIVYRALNNPYADRIIGELRKDHAGGLIAKGPHSGVQILTALKRGGSVAMLADQKLSSGIRVPFFGREAMTTPVIAEIALKYDLPIIPARIIRTEGAHFKCIIYPKLNYAPSGEHEKDVLAITAMINTMLEEWVREHPDQWFWVHRRWPEKTFDFSGA